MENKNLESELTLLDVFKILWKYRKFIIIFTIIVTLIGVTFVYFKSNTTRTIKVKKVSSIKNNIYLIEYSGIYDFELYNNIKKYINYYSINDIFNQFNINIKDFTSELSNDYKDNPYYYPVYKIKFIFIKNGKFESEEKIKINNLIKNILFFSYLKNKIINPFDFQNVNITYVNHLEKINNFGNSENIFINSIYLINFIDNYSLNKENIIKNLEENYNQILNIVKKELIVKEEKILKYFENITQYSYTKVKNLNYFDKEEEEEEVIFNVKTFLIKSFIVFVLSFFISIFLTFIIDFFKVYKKEIVG